MRSFVLLLASVCLQGQPSVEELNRLYSEYFEFTMRDSPESATLPGRNEFNDKWTDYAPAANERRKEAWRSYLARARRYRAASRPVSDRMSHQLFIDTLERRLESIEYEPYLSAVNHYVGTARVLSLTFEAAPGRTVKDLEDQIARLRATPEMVNGIIASANEGLRRKIQSPARTAQLLIPLLDAQSEGEAAQNSLLKAFRQSPSSIPLNESQRLTQDAAKAYEQSFRPAWRKLREYVSSNYIPQTRTSLGVSQNFNGAELMNQ